MRVKEESEKANLKLGFKKTEIMASGPITSWQVDAETVASTLPPDVFLVYPLTYQ